MNNFREILAYIKPYKRYGLASIFFNILYALFSTLSFIALIPVINTLFDKEKRVHTFPQWEGWTEAKTYIEQRFYYTVTQLADESETSTLLYVCMAVILLFFLKNLSGYFSNFFLTFLRHGVLTDLRDDMYRKIVSLPISFFSEKRKGDTIARITGDVSEVQNSFLSVLEMLIREPLTIIFTIIAMLLISTKLTLFVFIFLPVSGYIISLIGKQLKRRSTAAQQESGYFLSIIEETLSSLKIIKGFNAEGLFQQKFEASTSRLKHILNSLVNRQNLASPSSEFLGIFVIVVILWYGGRMVIIDNSLDPASFLTFMGLAYQILTPAKQISKAFYSVRRGNAAAERVLEILKTENSIQDQPDALDKRSFDRQIELDNITFSYGDTDVIKNFSLTVPKGSSVALVGQSGSGKSTLANLVTRFYDIQYGSITIDGTDIRTIQKQSLRKLMGLVTQDSILFNDTVRNNMLLGNPEATELQLIDALKVANAWEFVEHLPQGLDTNIGDSGNKLSGGQKQRLSIARAVLKDAPIMILDEATSALDTESERLVQDALEKMMRNRTSLVIAHRLSTIQAADHIVVMKKGEIVEQGKHSELLQLQGTYYNLVQMQSLDV